MNILFLSRLFDPHIGGVEKHVERISLELIKKGYVVTVLTEKFNTRLSSKEAVKGINIERINPGKDNWFKKFRIWKNILKNLKLLRDSDVIHIHDVFFWYLPFKLIFPRKKVYVTFHGYEGNIIPGIKARIMHKIAEKMSNGNICVGDFFQKWYGTKPDYIIYGGVDVNKKIVSKNLENKIKFLFIGRLEEEAGILEYIKSLTLLREKNYIFDCVILGDGSLRNLAENISKKNKLNIKFEGFKKNISKYLLDCDFVFTSRYLGILEAFSFNKFVFAVYNNEIKKDYLNMSPFSSFISISKDPEELYKSITFCIKNTKVREKSIAKGFKWIENLTWEKVSTIYRGLWSRI